MQEARVLVHCLFDGKMTGMELMEAAKRMMGRQMGLFDLLLRTASADSGNEEEVRNELPTI